eukprot:150963_1
MSNTYFHGVRCIARKYISLVHMIGTFITIILYGFLFGVLFIFIKQREDNANDIFKFDVSDIECNLNEYNKCIEHVNVKNEINKLRSNQKLYQERQLKYDNYANILWYQSQMITNGSKYGTSMYIYIVENFNEMNKDIIDKETNVNH